MTEPAPTPAFRRFPWVQLVFCLACLTMTAWTWMRYSYCWTLTPEWITAIGPSVVADDTRFPSRAYVEVTGRPFVFHEFPDGTGGSFWETSLHVGEKAWVRLSGTGAPPARGDMTVSGRLGVIHHGPDTPRMLYVESPVLYVYPPEGRFHPASVAGLVVGAMGCIIFGLYLRAWLRERKALASEPPQDMIA